MTLTEYKAEVLEDGVVDDAEVAKMKELAYEDGVIDRAEADDLFEINDAISGKEGNSALWPEFMADAISDHVTKDEESPGVIDADEAQYIVDKIMGDGQIDETEKLILTKIKEKASIIDPVLGKFIEDQGI